MSILIIYSPKKFDLECIEEFTKNFIDMKFVRGTPSELEAIKQAIKFTLEDADDKVNDCKGELNEGYYIGKALLKKLSEVGV